MGTDGEVVGRETLDKGRSILSICRQSRPPLYESHQKARNRMDDDPAKPWSPAQVAFDYIKGNSFRVVHADGVIGGPTPSGHVHMAFFSERGPIPRREVRAVNRDGTIGDLIPDQSIIRNAIVREVDIDVVMSLPVAESMISWLTTMVSDMKKMPPSDPGYADKRS